MSYMGYLIASLSFLAILLAFSGAKTSISLRNDFVKRPLLSGDEGTRTPDLLRAREALSHLSYIP
jgi:hypothetical protein